MNHRGTALWRIWWGLLPLFIYYLVNHMVVLTGGYILELQAGTWNGENGSGTIYLQTAIKMAGMFLGGAAIVPFYQKMSCEILQPDKDFRKKEMLRVVTAGAVLGAGLNIIFFLLGFTESSKVYTKVADSQFAVPFWVAVIFYGILSPIVEEIVFRGILYRDLKQNIGKLGAVLGSALLFGAFHGNIVQAVYGSIMGIFMAVFYERYGKIAAPVLFHSAANIIVYMLSFL